MMVCGVEISARILDLFGGRGVGLKSLANGLGGGVRKRGESKDDLFLGLEVEKLVMQQLGRLREKQVYSRKSIVPFWHSHVWALESNSLVQIQTWPLTNWVAFSGSAVPVTAKQYSCLRIAGKVRLMS